MSVRVPALYDQEYLGNLTLEQANAINSIRNCEKVDIFEHMVFDFPVDLIERSLNEGRSIREIVKTENIDYTQFIGTLRKYQTVGTAFMYLSPRSILGDGVGLGKTIETAALLNFLYQRKEMRRFLMCVDNSAVVQTQVELMRFTGLNIVVMPAEKPKIERMLRKTDWNKVDGIIMRHSTLRSDAFSFWLSLNLRDNGTKCNIYDTFILDESSVLKNEKTKTFKYAKNICDLACRAHFLNATAFETCLYDVYNQVDILNQTVLPSKYKFEKEFCTFKTSSFYITKKGEPCRQYKRDLTGYKNQSEFKNRLKLFYFGRHKKEIGLDLPHVHKVYYVEPTAAQLRAIQKGHRYNEILNSPVEVSDANIGLTREEVPKLDRTCELIEKEFTDVKVMVFAWHIEAQKALKRELEKIGRKPVILNGETPDSDRRMIQDEINNLNGKYDVIITNIKKSLNLYGADVCIFYSVLTNPAATFQAAGRIDRNVDDKIKTFILLLYAGTQEAEFFSGTVKNRAKNSRELTIDAKTAVDYFVENIVEQGKNI